MNGINKLSICRSGQREEENFDDAEEEGIAIETLPSTSRDPCLPDEPKWNSSTLALYEDNIKSSSSSSVGRPSSRERLLSATDSTSSDDSCVYMYKGADGMRNGDINKRVNCSSPDLDFLEMDFDPCQSNGHDSSDGSYGGDVRDLRDEEEESLILPFCSLLNPCDSNDEERNSTPVNKGGRSPSPNVVLSSQPLTTNHKLHEESNNTAESVTTDSDDNQNIFENVSESLNLEGSQVMATAESNNTAQTSESVDVQLPQDGIPHVESEETFSENNVILIKHILDGASHSNPRLGTLSCCLTTLSQAMRALASDIEAIGDFHEDFNDVDMTIPELLSKLSEGYLTVPKIQDSVRKGSADMLVTKFFHAHPSNLLKLSSMLHYWLQKGAVPVLCFNFHMTDKDCTTLVNSSWHYLLVHSVSQKGIHIFSQLEAVPEETLKKLFLNPSEILVMKDYIMAHWTPNSDLRPLQTNGDGSWRLYNVLGQVVNVIRDTVTGTSDGEIRYVRIPSPHRSGILIMMRSDNSNLQDLLDAKLPPNYSFLRNATLKKKQHESEIVFGFNISFQNFRTGTLTVSTRPRGHCH